MPTRILLLEDDFSLSEIMSEYLKEKGFELTSVFNAAEALDLAYESHFDLLLLDVKVPMGNGFELLESLREAGKETPAIFLTSLSSIDDISKGYDAGCDDYLKKPFELKELHLRIQTLLKRHFSHTSNDLIPITSSIAFDPLSLILMVDGHPTPLPSKESRLLKLFLAHRGETLSQSRIMEEIWDYDEDPSEMSLRVYVKNLRKFLGRETITTIKNTGYCLC